VGCRVGDNAAPPSAPSPPPFTREQGADKASPPLPPPRPPPPLHRAWTGRGARKRGRWRVPPLCTSPPEGGARDRRGHGCGRGHAYREREPRNGQPLPLYPSGAAGPPPSLCVRGCRAKGGPCWPWEWAPRRPAPMCARTRR
jgi:hypothetical protein